MDLMRRSVLRVAVVALLVAVAIGATAFWVLTIPARVDASELAPHRPDLENGRTMFLAGGCASCHAPDQEERTRLAGGVALKSPFGTFYSPNISPDSANGIGNWTEAEFVTAMSKGTSPEGRHYYPAFPYTSYQRMQEADVRDLFAYLKTLPAVPGRARDHDLRFRCGCGAASDCGNCCFSMADGSRLTPPVRSSGIGAHIW